MTTYWVIADYSPFGTVREPPIVVKDFSSKYKFVAFIMAWWFANRHTHEHPYGKAVIMNRPPPMIGDARNIAD